jgi:hypothetical protein
MKPGNILTLIALLFFLACKNHSSVTDSPTKPTKEPGDTILKTQDLPFLDTIIVLSGAKDLSITNKKLSEKEAQALLYKYFEKKGIRTRNDPKDTSLNSKDRLCVDYDTMYQIQTNKFSGAIVSYWLGPADLNGHCFRPGKAIILDTKEGFKFTNEGFIPKNFEIDSVIKSNIHGYDYDCGGRGIIRYLKVTLKPQTKQE